MLQAVPIPNEQRHSGTPGSYAAPPKNELVVTGNERTAPKMSEGHSAAQLRIKSLMLCLIQSIPSPKVEPFKMWLAKVGYERIEETEDPELAFGHAMETYLAKGYSKEWINQRLKSIEVRKN